MLKFDHFFGISLCLILCKIYRPQSGDSSRDHLIDPPLKWEVTNRVAWKVDHPSRFWGFCIRPFFRGKKIAGFRRCGWLIFVLLAFSFKVLPVKINPCIEFMGFYW